MTNPYHGPGGQLGHYVVNEHGAQIWVPAQPAPHRRNWRVIFGLAGLVIVVSFIVAVAESQALQVKLLAAGVVLAVIFAAVVFIDNTFLRGSIRKALGRRKKKSSH